MQKSTVPNYNKIDEFISKVKKDNKEKCITITVSVSNGDDAIHINKVACGLTYKNAYKNRYDIKVKSQEEIRKHITEITKYYSNLKGYKICPFLIKTRECESLIISWDDEEQ